MQCNPEAPLKQILWKRCFNIGHERQAVSQGTAFSTIVLNSTFVFLVSCKPSETMSRWSYIIFLGPREVNAKAEPCKVIWRKIFVYEKWEVYANIIL